MADQPHPRASWDQYFMSIAQVVATRSTCPRKYVGAVIVRNRTILSTGYNGSIRGMPHCSDVGHMMEDGHCVATIHAEANAIIQAARNGVNIDGATNYVTASPCWNCFKQLANGGIVRIVSTVPVDAPYEVVVVKVPRFRPDLRAVTDAIVEADRRA